MNTRVRAIDLMPGDVVEGLVKGSCLLLTHEVLRNGLIYAWVMDQQATTYYLHFGQSRLFTIDQEGAVPL